MAICNKNNITNISKTQHMYQKNRKTTMTYRKTTQQDLDVVLALKNQVKARVIAENLAIWQDGYPQDQLIVDDFANGFGRVVEIDGRIVGYATFHPAHYEYPKDTFKSNNVMSFGRVMVANDFVGKHVGSFLVKNMIAEARNLGYEGVGILVDDFNTRATQLYYHLGFVKEGRNLFPWAELDILALYFH